MGKKIERRHCSDCGQETRLYEDGEPQGCENPACPSHEDPHVRI